MVFDDAAEHQGWNRSDTVGVVLLQDFLKPGAAFNPPLEDVVSMVFSQEKDKEPLGART
jgi:hypothetical protein